MIVYDFDKTIFLGESSTAFYRFCVPRHPLILLWLPVAGIFGLGKLLHLCDTRRWKEAFHGYLRLVPDAENLVEKFWDRNQDRIAPWLPEKLKYGGLVISLDNVFPNGFSLELKNGGKATFHYDGKDYGMKWTLEGESFHASGGGAELDGTLSNGVMQLIDVLNSGIDITLVNADYGK